MKNTLRRLAVAGTAAVAFASAGAVNATTAQAADWQFHSIHSSHKDCWDTGWWGAVKGEWADWGCALNAPIMGAWNLAVKPFDA
ncbi:hypothetical protein [Amycolatopsis sp. 195334CR]|uniref:hypothetical protein n=1 Tax=Amycolatopsis sp. 195334CR TaxID=2814588 RepID=UPI001A8C277C|nr:hypothetical protein [Amycolatopsis sp. 195334CR]MBN6042136.1 hypothetical protein [Amycolatopsis sp. 195334CR]